MTTRQLDIFGHETILTGDHTAEALNIAETYPQALTDPGHFLFLVAKRRYQWLGGLSEDQRNSLRGFFREAQSLDRRRQEIRERLEKGLPLRS